MNVQLRIATPDDAPIIHDIYGYYINHTVATFNEVNKSIQKHREEIAALLEQYPFLIAENDGQFLGFANAEPIRPQSGYRFCVELTIYLHPDTPKHSGVGKKLYSALFDILQKQGYRSAFAVLEANNEASIALHSHFGFEELVRFPNVGYKHGIWLDSLWLRKDFNVFDENPSLPIPFSIFREHLTLN